MYSSSFARSIRQCPRPPNWIAERSPDFAYTAERDIRAVQELLGHSTPETTARYTAIPDGALRAAVLAASA